MMTFNDLAGKTIVSATQMKSISFDDLGYLKLEFSDGTNAVITAQIMDFTGDSENEYRTNITIGKRAVEKLTDITPNDFIQD